MPNPHPLPSTPAPLRLQGLKKVFPGTTAEQSAGVRGLDLEIQAGEGFSLLGPSGCGKTTTLRIVGGFESPDEGRVFHGNRDITDLEPQHRDIRTVFQKYALFPHLSVAENIAFSLRMRKLPTAVIQSKVDGIIELIGIRHLLGRQIAKLSGGEQQRVALARALVSEPGVLLLDEPFSALDLKLRERMQTELLALRKKLGTTFIFVTHDQGEAMFLSDRIGVMNKGRLEQVGSPEQIYNQPETRFVASFIGQANFFPTDIAQELRGPKDRLPTLAANEIWMVRPEKLRLTARVQGLRDAEIGLKAKVKEHAFLGQDRLTRVVLASGLEILIRRPGIEAAVGRDNEDVWIAWEPGSSWKVADGPSC